jgi:uncharacterized membrane protein
MKTTTLPLTQVRKLPTLGLFLFLLLAVAAYYGVKYGLPYFVSYPERKLTSPLLLLPHIGTGFIALVLGPLQFWKGFRQKYLRIHRWTGRIYLSAVAISAAFGLYLAVVNPNLVFSTGITGLALAWIVTGTFAYLTIRRRLVSEHREWMIRNYVVTLGFVSYRIGYEFMHSIGYEETVIMAWLCWAPQLLITEYCLQLSRSGLFNNRNRTKISRTIQSVPKEEAIA